MIRIEEKVNDIKQKYNAINLSPCNIKLSILFCRRYANAKTLYCYSV